MRVDPCSGCPSFLLDDGCGDCLIPESVSDFDADNSEAVVRLRTHIGGC